MNSINLFPLAAGIAFLGIAFGSEVVVGIGGAACMVAAVLR